MISRNNGGVMNHETSESIQKRRKPFTVDYAGFGWLLIKHGVFEHSDIKYPWFAPKMQVFESGEVQDMWEKMYHSVSMQKKQVLKFGAILVSESVTKKQGSSDEKTDKIYNSPQR